MNLNGGALAWRYDGRLSGSTAKRARRRRLRLDTEIVFVSRHEHMQKPTSERRDGDRPIGPT